MTDYLVELLSNPAVGGGALAVVAALAVRWARESGADATINARENVDAWKTLYEMAADQIAAQEQRHATERAAWAAERAALLDRLRGSGDSGV